MAISSFFFLALYIVVNGKVDMFLRKYVGSGSLKILR